MSVPARPTDVVWDITYACPLRCTHCYSESGRRPSRQLGLDDLYRVTDALISLRPGWITLAGGEPLVVPGILDLARRIRAAGISVALYTAGWSMDSALAADLLTSVDRVNVSVDGATATVHDRIRGRSGSFTRATATLTRLDHEAARLRAAGSRVAEFGVDCTVVRSNFDQLDALCTWATRQFPGLGFLWFGAAMPIGLASRPSFVDAELLTDELADELTEPATTDRLRALAPSTVTVGVTDNRLLQVHPEHIARGLYPFMQVEPDGAVRAMPIYEGTVGSLLTEDPTVLWRRSADRWTDPVVTGALGPARTMREWAEATRVIDQHFGDPLVRSRIERRPAYLAQTAR
ncbi:radical SAM protein [Micromonospora eburnea]|uniref:Radical SAM superfamily enzyme, MoaA/NifB/PqqE/SkfB family n=1 Tax=Micromonospora eburnea TaxID=227316 RepID=A0A1C6UWM5_9ACTN|nr:radical SAM protein [Micromonospora eburnea]SCL58455.1 Radical SAM superfamily enzyme, MoaA/NifB/PqqE/SkfB family [Micromonospora eburnea]